METQRHRLTGQFQMPSVQQDTLPRWVKWLLGAIMLWCAIQAAFLIVAFSGGPPSPTAELVSTHNDLQYRASLGFHIFAFLVLGSVWVAPSSIRRNRESLIVVLVSVIALTLATVFFVSIHQANYQIYLDLHEEQFIRRDIHLQPPGVITKVISFKDIQTVNADLTDPAITPSP